jgi:hypothetical protein
LAENWLAGIVLRLNFLLDENVLRDACKLLREKGHHCRTMAELKGDFVGT